jgi:hypothetical protein
MADKYYKEQGGNYRPIVDFGSQAPKDLSGPMPKGSNDFFRAGQSDKLSGVFDDFKGGSGEPSAKTVTAKSGSKEVALPRAIIGEVKTTTGARYGLASGSLAGTIRQNKGASADADITFITYPKSGLSTPVSPSQTSQQKQPTSYTPFPNIITPTVPTTKNEPANYSPPLIGPITEPTSPNTKPIPVSPIFKPPANPVNTHPDNGLIPISPITPVINPGVNNTPKVVPVPPIITPIITPRNTPTYVTTPRNIPEVIPKTTPIYTPSSTPQEKTTPIPFVPNYPPPNKQKLSSPLAVFPRGNGNSFGGRRPKGGAFFERTNKVVTPKMLASRFIGGPQPNVKVTSNRQVSNKRNSRGRR